MEEPPPSNPWGAPQQASQDSEGSSEPTFLGSLATEDVGRPRSGRPQSTMSFRDGLVTCFLIKYREFDGRASRSEYGWLMLITFMVVGVSFAGIFMSGSAGVAIITPLYLLFALYPIVGATVRRLHDCGQPGWLAVFLLTLYLAPVGILLLLLVKGESGQNVYGQPPTNVLQ